MIPIGASSRRQDYLVNWLVRKDKKNIQLSAIAAVDNDYRYCFDCKRWRLWVDFTKLLYGAY